MAINPQKVFNGGPDQLVTGAILSAPLSVAPLVDDDIYNDNFPGFTDSGYVNEDGLTLGMSKTFESIKDWDKSVVKRVLTEFDGTVSYKHLAVDEYSLGDMFGAQNVQVTPADGTHGEQFKVSVGADDLPSKQVLIKMKSGDARMRIYLPNATVTETEDVVFQRNTPIQLGVKLGAQPDANGRSIYIFFDDGIKV